MTCAPPRQPERPFRSGGRHMSTSNPTGTSVLASVRLLLCAFQQPRYLLLLMQPLVAERPPVWARRGRTALPGALGTAARPLKPLLKKVAADRQCRLDLRGVASAVRPCQLARMRSERVVDGFVRAVRRKPPRAAPGTNSHCVLGKHCH